ncbi:MAG: hypothetical protein JXA66_01970, partial [Oligoflexia bacterium]|nr:hypothetical protein [Oligoflexia bacterium]
SLDFLLPFRRFCHLNFYSTFVRIFQPIIYFGKEYYQFPDTEKIFISGFYGCHSCVFPIHYTYLEKNQTVYEIKLPFGTGRHGHCFSEKEWGAYFIKYDSKKLSIGTEEN